jgi:hypothetical protein
LKAKLMVVVGRREEVWQYLMVSALYDLHGCRLRCFHEPSWLCPGHWFQVECNIEEVSIWNRMSMVEMQLSKALGR